MIFAAELQYITQKMELSPLFCHITHGHPPQLHSPQKQKEKQVTLVSLFPNPY